MKRFYPILACLSILLLWGCPQKEEETPVLTPIQTTYNISADAGSFNISVKTNQKFTAESNVSWISVSIPTKAVTTETVSVTVQANPDEKVRTGKVTVSAGSLSATVTINQDGKTKEDPGPEPPDPEDPDKLENAGSSLFNVSYGGGDITVKVRTNVEYSVEVSENWISRTKAGSVHVDDLVFHVSANDGAERSATITFTYGSALSFSVTVRQEAYSEPAEQPYLNLSDTELSIGSAGGELSVGVESNFAYTADPDVSWVTVTKADETCVLNVANNPSEDSRVAQIMFSCEGLVEYLNISQAGADTGDPFDVGSNLSVNGNANCYVVTKAGNYTFEATVMGNGPDGFLWEEGDAMAQFLWPTEVESVSLINYGREKPDRAEIMWDDNATISNVSIDDKLKVSFTASGNKGNALIAVYNGSLLLWSWHIWCTDSPKLLRHETMDGTKIVMLDRNLGATSCVPEDGKATYGYWYQFGRKDPLKLYNGVAHFMETGEQSMEHSVEHPTAIYKIFGKTTEWFNGSVTTITADLWGNPYAMHNGADHLYQAPMSELRKTIYDPCPPGYMVPPEWAWDSYSMDDCTVSDYGLTFAVENGDSFYPFAGFGDSGDAYGGDNGWYGYPGFTPNMAPDGKYHHNMRNVVCCWSSSSARHFDPQYNSENYHHAYMFYYLQDEDASQNYTMVNENSQAHFYTKYAHIRERCCTVRCMRIQ